MERKEKWRITYLYRQEKYESVVDSLEKAFSVVDEMENTVGGVAYSIAKNDEFPLYMRNFDDEEGKAYWVSLLTGDKFVEYRR